MLSGPQALAILIFERIKGRNANARGRGFSWGPSSDKKPVHQGLGIGGIGGIGILNRHSMWAGATGRLGAGRLAGGRLGFGNGGLQAGAAPTSSSSIDERLETPEPVAPRASRLAPEDQEELRRVRAAVDELTRKMDLVLSQGREWEGTADVGGG